MKKLTLLISLLISSVSIYAQNTMGIGTEDPNPNAVLDIVSPNGNQGILIPRYSTIDRTAVAFTDNLTNTDNGLMVFDTDEGTLYFWYNGNWISAANKTIADLLSENSDVGGQSITNLGSPVSDLDAVTKIYVDTLIANNTPWTITASNLSYNLGNVGVGIDSAISPLQVQDKLHFYHFQNDAQGVNGRIIADNLYSDGTTIRNVQDGTGALIYMSSYGDIEFIHADTSTAGVDRFSELESSLRLKGDLSAEFLSSVEIVGDLGIGESAPSAKLDVVGDTELNGSLYSNGAVYSAVASFVSNRAVRDTDHILSLIGTVDQTVFLPLSSDHIGRELVIIIEAVDQVNLNHSVELEAGDSFIFEGRIDTTPIIMSSGFGGITMLTLRALGSGWVVMNYLISTNG